MTAFEKYWEDKGHLGCNPREVAARAWDAATREALGVRTCSNTILRNATLCDSRKPVDTFSDKPGHCDECGQPIATHQPFAAARCTQHDQELDADGKCSTCEFEDGRDEAADRNLDAVAEGE